MKAIGYKAPSWLTQSTLVNQNRVPKYRFQFVDTATPTGIERLRLEQLEHTNYELYVKRDDLTHRNLHLQGNKLRKLEFLMADAVMTHSAKHIITAGGIQSNHARAVAGLASQLGLHSHFFLRSNKFKTDELSTNGNLLIDRLLDASIYLVEKKSKYANDIEYKMQIVADRLKQKHGDEEGRSYLIPIGGSNSVGLFGYLEQFDEMLNRQKIDQFIDDVVVTTGSGGTMSGLAIGNHLTGAKVNLHAFCVCDNRDYFLAHLKSQMAELFLKQDISPIDMVNIVECSKGLGYGESSRDELAFLVDVFRQTGILLDPVYTGKTLYTLVNVLLGRRPTAAYDNDRMVSDFRKNLKGKRILFVHTGGQLGLFDHNKFKTLLDDESDSSKSSQKVFDCRGQKIDTIHL